MSDSLEIVYYGKGFSKGKNGGQKALTGITIGRGSPVPAILSALSMLTSSNPEFWKEMDSAFLHFALSQEVEKFKRNI